MIKVNHKLFVTKKNIDELNIDKTEVKCQRLLFIFSKMFNKRNLFNFGCILVIQLKKRIDYEQFSQKNDSVMI